MPNQEVQDKLNELVLSKVLKRYDPDDEEKSNPTVMPFLDFKYEVQYINSKFISISFRIIASQGLGNNNSFTPNYIMMDLNTGEEFSIKDFFIISDEFLSKIMIFENTHLYKNYEDEELERYKSYFYPYSKNGVNGFYAHREISEYVDNRPSQATGYLTNENDIVKLVIGHEAAYLTITR